jgi:hypothetical protein
MVFIKSARKILSVWFEESDNGTRFLVVQYCHSMRESDTKGLGKWVQLVIYFSSKIRHHTKNEIIHGFQRQVVAKDIFHYYKCFTSQNPMIIDQNVTWYHFLHQVYPGGRSLILVP